MILNITFAVLIKITVWIILSFVDISVNKAYINDIDNPVLGMALLGDITGVHQNTGKIQYIFPQLETDIWAGAAVIFFSIINRLEVADFALQMFWAFDIDGIFIVVPQGNSSQRNWNIIFPDPFVIVILIIGGELYSRR